VLSSLVGALFIVDKIAHSNAARASKAASAGASASADGPGEASLSLSPERRSQFKWFQAQYLAAYLLIMLADWLQGTHMYTLYTEYGVDVGLLFQTGFLSSAVFGTFVGIYVDKCGRRLGCIVFCLLEVVINTLEHYPSMPLLLLGRVLGGVSTSLLFSAFESWVVSAHRAQGFPEELLHETFALSASGSGLMAILAGLLAQRACDLSGNIGPFRVAIALTVVVLVLVCFWKENYGGAAAGPPMGPGTKESSIRKGKGEGEEKEKEVAAAGGAEAEAEAEADQKGILASISDAYGVVCASPEILCLGLSQAFFEGAVYSFVFCWVPALQAVAGDESIPTGIVFSSFMLALTLGGQLSSLLGLWFTGTGTGTSTLAYLVAMLCMCVPIVKFEFHPVFAAFLVLEAMVGVFNSSGAVLRSVYYPEDMQSSIITFFRLPLNLLVVLGTTAANRAGSDIASLKNVFALMAGMMGVSLALLTVVQMRGKGKGKLKDE